LSSGNWAVLIILMKNCPAAKRTTGRGKARYLSNQAGKRGIPAL